MIKRLKSLIFLCLFFSILYAGDLEYQSPGGIIEEIFNRPYNPSVTIYEDLGIKLYKDRSLYIPLDILAEPITQLAGIKIYEKSRAKTRSSFFTSFKWAELYSDKLNTIDLPKNSIFGAEIASFDNKKVACLEYKKDRIDIWLIHLDSLKTAYNAVEKLSIGRINQVFDNSIEWLPDNKSLLIKIVAEDLEKPNAANGLPKGPIISQASGKVSQNRTYPHLLKDQNDEDLFEYYAHSQLIIYDIESKTTRKVLEPMMLSYTQSSPDGKYLLCNEKVKPFSRKAPYYSFSSQWVVIDLINNQKMILSESPLRDDLKTGWVNKGIRSYWWDNAKDHSLFRLKTLDDGNPESKNKYKDEVAAINLPNYKKAQRLYQSKFRVSGYENITDEIVLIREYQWKEKRQKTFYRNTISKQEYLVYEGLTEEIYDLPGTLYYETTNDGRSKPFIADNCVFYIGTGLSKDSRKPFIDRLNLQTFKKERLIEFDEEDYITISRFLNHNQDKFFLYRQNQMTPANLFVHDLKTKDEKAITNFTDNVEELTNLKKSVIHYSRADSVLLSGVLYLPADYDGEKPLPLIMSAYPREFTDTETASQSSHSDKQYIRPWSSSPLYFCLDGFAVLQDASFPIIGDPETVNNTWKEQAVENAKAAIDYLANEGIVDPEKVIIQGHSYGAFMVVNLLAHCDLFAGGIARNGAYNRTLTPFGFQKERRTLWEAKDTYLNLSPFLYVDQIQKPLLLIHSLEDSNSGTFPIQSQRLYEALEGNGKDCRYVQLPLEDHTYYAKETHLHLLWEYQQFFKRVFAAD